MGHLQVNCSDDFQTCHSLVVLLFHIYICIYTYSTEDGFRQPDRLPKGIKTAPAIFQSYASTTLAGIPSCEVVVDDICVTGPNTSEHFKNLESVLHRLEKAGMKLNPENVSFTYQR